MSSSSEGETAPPSLQVEPAGLPEGRNSINPRKRLSSSLQATAHPDPAKPQAGKKVTISTEDRLDQQIKTKRPATNDQPDRNSRQRSCSSRRLPRYKGGRNLKDEEARGRSAQRRSGKSKERRADNRSGCKKVDEPVVIEVFCGSAKLTAAFRRRGISALGIDWKMNRHKSCGPWVQLDLTTDEGRRDLRALLQSNSALRLVWIGLPCGTASRAREIQFQEGLPQPLRTVQEPWGRTDVRGLSWKRRMRCTDWP